MRMKTKEGQILTQEEVAQMLIDIFDALSALGGEHVQAAANTTGKVVMALLAKGKVVPNNLVAHVVVASLIRGMPGTMKESEDREAALKRLKTIIGAWSAYGSRVGETIVKYEPQLGAQVPTESPHGPN